MRSSERPGDAKPKSIPGRSSVLHIFDDKHKLSDWKLHQKIAVEQGDVDLEVASEGVMWCAACYH